MAKARYVGVRRGAHVFLTADEGEKQRLREKARQCGHRVHFIDHITDPMVAECIQLGGIAHDDLSYRYETGKDQKCRRVKMASMRP